MKLARKRRRHVAGRWCTVSGLLDIEPTPLLCGEMFEIRKGEKYSSY